MPLMGRDLDSISFFYLKNSLKFSRRPLFNCLQYFLLIIFYPANVSECVLKTCEFTSQSRPLAVCIMYEQTCITNNE